MDKEELKELKERKKLEERHAHLVNEHEESHDEEEEMKVSGASVRDIARQQEKRRKK